MNHFWSKIIKPIIKSIDANYIVEVGSDAGINTKNILEYCVENDTHMTAIDPIPKFDIYEFKAKYGDKFEIYPELSLSRLPLLKDYDVILLDGDHNWYTVYNELKIIEKNFKDKKYPLIFLHDVGWPYARRDLYYNPENIPEAYRQPYKQAGMFPDQTELKENIGLNHQLYNAIYENNPKNGVLTAIEDFIEESNLKFTFKNVNAFYGLGILFTKNDRLDNIIEETIRSSNLLDYLEKLRVETGITTSQITNRNSLLEKYLNEKETQLKQTQNQLSTSNQKIQEKETLIQTIEQQKTETQTQLKQTQNQLSTSNQKIQEKETLIKEGISKLERQLDIIKNKLDSKIELLQAKEFHINSLEEQLKRRSKQAIQNIDKYNKTNAKLKEANKKLIETQNKLKYSNNKINKLTLQINNIYTHFLEMQYLKGDNRSSWQKLISKFPSSFILGNFRKTGLKNAILTVKGYRAIKKNKLFDIGYYLKNNPHIIENGVDPLLHYIYHGYKENRNPNSSFNSHYYMATYPDVRKSNLNPLVHYSLYGIHEFRNIKNNCYSS